MVNALIGNLPTGWGEVNLVEISDLRAGAATSGGSDGPVRVLKPRNLVGGRITGVVDRIDDKEAGRLTRYQLKAGDIACVRTGALGRHAPARPEHEGWLFGTGIIRVRPSDRVDARYLDNYLSHPRVLDWLNRNAVGSPIPSISTAVLGTLPVALPPVEMQQWIGHTLDALSEKITAHERISRATAALRDTLIPLLLSGTVNVREK